MAYECELFERCRQAATDAHRIHLVGTSSGYHHLILDDFYHGIVDKADSFMEAFLGRNKDCGFDSFPAIKPSGLDDGSAVVKALRAWIDGRRGKMAQETELQNLVDEIVSFCDSIIFKLDRFA